MVGQKPFAPVAGKSKPVRVPRDLEILDLFAMHTLWCEVHFAARQAHESVARASVRVAAWSRRVRTGGIRRPTRGTIPVQTFAEINGF